MHDGFNGYDCGLIYYNYAEEEKDREYKPLSHHSETKATSIETYHYGHVRSNKSYLEKKNNIERSYHPEWKDLKKWEWDMSGTSKFIGSHPKSMKERIERFKNEN